MLTWEFSVLDFIQAHLRSEIGDTVMVFITHLGDGGVIWIVLTLAVLIGFSRLYLYVRYPSDVLAGAALGVLLGWVGCALVSRVENRRAVQKRG